MEKRINKQVAVYQKDRSRRKRHQRFLAALSVLVLLVTTYAMRLPATTESTEVFCGHAEHTEHSVEAGCYETLSTLICDIAENHTHTEECYTQTPVLVCTLPESEGHTHDDSCYTEKRTLVCDEEETDGHAHGDSCYDVKRTLACDQEETDGHTHGDSCYETVKVLDCSSEEEDHEHTDACYREERKLVCDKKEKPAHHHDDSCYQEERILVCELEEKPAHHHGDECYFVEQELTCGLEESGHQHTESCYAEGEAVLTCTIPENHVHTEECYETTQNLICTVPLHTHTLQCYSDPNADVESRSTWENSIKGAELTGEWNLDVIEIANTQLKYKESTKNYIVLEDGQTKKGYTRYGDWAGMPYEDWCAMFCSFCIRYAGIPEKEMPTCSGVNRWIKALEDAHLYQDNLSGYTPAVGDLIFFDWDKDEKGDHVGLVYEVKDNTVYTIEGNKGISVKKLSYELDDRDILGFGIMPENPDYEYEPEISEEPTLAPVEVEPTLAPVEVEPTLAPVEVEPTFAPVEAEPTFAPVEAEPTFAPVEVEPTTEPVEAEPTLEPVEAEPTLEPVEAEPTLENVEIDPTAEDVLVPSDDVDALQGNADPEMLLMPGMPNAMPLMLLSTPPTDPLRVEDYLKKDESGETVTGVNMYFRPHDSMSDDDWRSVTSLADDETVPGNASLKLNIEFANVPVDDLIAAAYQMTLDIPDVMRDPQISQKLMSGSVQVGTLSIVDNKVHLSFDEDWVDQQRSEDEDIKSVINGDFWVVSSVDLSAVEEENPAHIEIGDVDITIPFEDDVVEKYGDATVAKELDGGLEHDETDDGWYLKYIVSVKAGEDGCSAASVVDAFEDADLAYISGYDILSFTKGTASAKDDRSDAEGTTDGSLKLKWEIGDMAPNEEATLSYRVKVDESFVGKAARNPLNNGANLYSNDFPKDDSTVEYTPKADVTIAKILTSNGTDIGADGGWYVYRIAVTAPADNDYPLSDVMIRDVLQNTAPELLCHMEYDVEDTRFWKLYTGTASTGASYVRGNLKDEKYCLTFNADENGDGKCNDGFSVKIGELQPGETLCIRYPVNVDAGFLPALGGSNGTITNVGEVVLDETEPPVNTARKDTTIAHENWVKKMASDERIVSAQEISIPAEDEVYQYNGSSVTPVTNTGNIVYTIPAGSYAYTIDANQSGKWDISGTTMTDTMNKAWMEYQGYIKAEAYTVNGDTSTPAKTVWINVDNLRSFAFKPMDIGLSGQYAYKLQYYAKPETTETLTNPVVSNTLRVEGDVIGEDGNKYTLTGNEVTADVTVQTDTSIVAHKNAWYYDNTEDDRLDDGVNTGSCYWYLQADGYIEQGLSFYDYLGTGSRFTLDSVIGVYKGDLGSQTPKDYKKVDALLKSELLTELDPSKYSVTYYYGRKTTMSSSNTLATEENFNNEAVQTLKVTMNEQIPLAAGESLYVIIRSHPRKSDYTDIAIGSRQSFGNNMKLIHSDNTTTPVENVSLYVSRNMQMYKMAYSGTYDGTTMTGKLSQNLASGVEVTITSDVANHAVIDGGSMKPGHYINWPIQLDRMDNMEGRYRLIDTMPEGLEPEFVYVFFLSSKYKNTGNNEEPHFVEITDFPEGTWTRHTSTMKGHKGSATNWTEFTTIWYTDRNNRVLFDIDGFHYPIESSAGVELIIGSRVTDTKVLIGDNSGEYRNNAKLYNDEGTELDGSSANMDISVDNIDKRIDAAVYTNPIPYEIEVNKLGEDLKSKDNDITIIDTMSDNQTFDPESVQVIDVATNTPITNWVLSVDSDSNTFRLNVPDNKHLVIKYNAKVNVPPNTPTEIWNDAYWEGQDQPDEHDVEVEKYEYSVGGSVDADTPASVKIIKNDKSNATKTLPGAKFKLEQMIEVRDPDTNAIIRFETDPSFLPLIGTTEANGTCVFGNGKLSINTVYRFIETEAPHPYEKDDTYHYFIVAKKVKPDSTSEKVYPQFVSDVIAWNQTPSETKDPSNITVQYWEDSPQYQIHVYDPPITYSLPQTGGKGTYPIYALGAVIALCAIMLGYGFKRRRKRGEQSV